MTDQARPHAAILRDVEKLNGRVRRAQKSLDVLLDERRALYLEARDRPDPVSFGKLGKAAGTTEGAVMQVVAKAMREVQS